MTPDLNVLLVEDETEEKDFFIQGLKKLNLNYQVSWAQNHAALFSILEMGAGVDLVIIDLEMPGLDGRECLKDMKANEKYKALPAIVMTVSKNMKDINDVYDHGAHYYAIKPYSQSNFIETLRTIFTIDWKKPQPIPEKKNFIINLAFA